MKKLIINSPKYGRYKVLIDDADFALVSKHRWHVNLVPNSSLVYAKTNIYNSSTQKCKSVTMHRMILGFPEKNKVVDHKNGNGLDNRRKNIRLCKQHQNASNQKLIQSNNTTGYRGVVFEPKKQLYRAHIGHQNKRVRGGRFKNPIDAARRYNELAIKYHGEFAKLNKV